MAVRGHWLSVVVSLWPGIPLCGPSPRHSSFAFRRNVEGALAESGVAFRYVRAQPPRIVLLVDDTDVMNVQVSRCWSRDAVLLFRSR